MTTDEQLADLQKLQDAQNAQFQNALERRQQLDGLDEPLRRLALAERLVTLAENTLKLIAEVAFVPRTFVYPISDSGPEVRDGAQ